MPKTILIMAGGTGGHVFPGIAVAKEMQSRGWQIHWLGTPKRMEADLVPKAGFDISFINVEGVRGNGLLRLLKAPFQIIHAVQQAWLVIKRIKPDVILGMGGFASGPGGIAAWLRGIPLVVHEQNALPGLTNKLLAKIANKVLLGFNSGFEQVHEKQDKYIWVGNPVRNDFASLTPKDSHKELAHILIVGGSLGAMTLNQNVPTALAQFEGISIRHQTGRGHSDSVNTRYQQLITNQVDWQVSEFIDDMANAYDWADLVICRAGALTVAEVAMSGVAAIFVPLPHAVDDHQTMNANALAKHKAAYLLPQSELEKGGLVDVIRLALSDPNKRCEMGIKARSLAKPDATQTVCNICECLGGVAA